jgi:hypothetical protein
MTSRLLSALFWGLSLMTKYELNKKIDRRLAESRAVTEKADAFFRWFDREAPIHEARTKRVFRELRESVRPR